MVAEVLPRVPFRQLVFTIPRRLRKYFLFDRSLYGDLCRVAYASTRDFLRQKAPAGFARLRRAVPAMVVVPQSFADLLVPHAHALCSLGLFSPEGTFLRMDAVEVPQPKSPGPGRPPGPKRELPEDRCYATVRKTREKGRVVEVACKLVFGTAATLSALLSRSLVSRTINTSFVERNNGTDRAQNSRKTRKTYCFSKDWDMHNAASYFIGFSYNFCWPVRTLRSQGGDGQWLPRIPAMAAGLADHVWTTEEWVTYPARGP